MATVEMRGFEAYYESESSSKLQQMYRFMRLARCVDEKCVNLQRQGKIAFYLPQIGHEACSVGSAFTLENEDWVFPGYREIAGALVRGYSLRDLFSQFRGTVNDAQKGRQMPVFFSDRSIRWVSTSAPVGNRIIHAVGVALAAKLKGDKIVSLVYFGDGTTSTADFHTGLNFAGVFQTPTIFFCLNNQYAISLPFERQTASESIAIKAKAYGIDGVRIDGNNVLQVYNVTKAAVEHARNAGRPTLIEALTYRLAGHSTSDDPTRYRSSAEVSEWMRQDPVEKFKVFLISKNLWSNEMEEKLKEESVALIDDAVDYMEKAELPSKETLIQDVYADVPDNLREELDDMLSSE
ncbi:MAG: thiamine pyrophosphate-dependent enzyme [Thaumarchaeota archaeon]|nr:thiamine pyrophosphate-dependent enzyme [Nitrososphaerota archaeon]